MPYTVLEVAKDTYKIKIILFKQIRMCACMGKVNLTRIIVNHIDEKPVGFNMTLHAAKLFSLQRMFF
ncbi:hypothetical protein AGMMS49983_14070 [Clostridia bacterium]|nr:hypothetical protein AGMMS49983_14070 [Clostridia bacterium]